MRVQILMEIGPTLEAFEFRVGGIDLALLDRDPERFYRDYIEPIAVMATKGFSEKMLNRH